MADRFEYLNHSPFFGPGRPHAPREEWLAELNALGAQGWEVVGPTELWVLGADGAVAEAPISMLLLKRRVA